MEQITGFELASLEFFYTKLRKYRSYHLDKKDMLEFYSTKLKKYRKLSFG